MSKHLAATATTAALPVGYLLSGIPVNQLVNSQVLNLCISDPMNEDIQMPTLFGQHKILSVARCIRRKQEKET